MTAEKEKLIREIVKADPTVSPINVEIAFDLIREKDESAASDRPIPPLVVAELLDVPRYTINYYLKKGLLKRIYRGSEHALGISRKSVLKFMKERYDPYQSLITNN